MGMIIAILIAVALLNFGEKHQESDDFKEAASGLFSEGLGTIMGAVILVITIILIGSL